MDTPPRETSSATNQLGEHALAVAAALGDRVAFETIVHRYGPLLYGYVRRMISDCDAVDDVVRELRTANALAALAQARARLGERTLLLAWAAVLALAVAAIVPSASWVAAGPDAREAAALAAEAGAEALPCGGAAHAGGAASGPVSSSHSAASSTVPGARCIDQPCAKSPPVSGAARISMKPSGSAAAATKLRAKPRSVRAAADSAGRCWRCRGERAGERIGVTARREAPAERSEAVR